MKSKWGVMCLALIAAFALTLAAKDKKTDEKIDTPLQPEARAYVFPGCFISDDTPKANAATKSALDVVSSFIPSAVGVGYSALVAALKAAGDAKEFDQKFAAAPFYLYEASATIDSGGTTKVTTGSHLGCVVLVDGVFQKDAPPAPVVGHYLVKKTCKLSCAAKTEDCAKCLSDNAIPVEKIHALYEAEVFASEDQTAILFGSRHFQVRDWLQTGRENRKHSYVITLNLAAPGSKKDDDNIQSTAILDLGPRQLDTVYTPNVLPSSSGWMGGGLGLTDTDKSRVKDLASSKNAATIQLRPTTLYATIAETAEGSKFAATLATYLDAAKGDATKAIATAVNPQTFITKEQTDASDLEKARQTEEKSYDALLTAQIALVKGQAATPALTTVELDKLRADVSIAQRGFCRDWNAIKTYNATAPDRGPASIACK
jgi:hypothetical protein